MYGNFNLADILSAAVAIVVAISVHEFGHAYVAHLFGDDTAKNMGRMSFNPMHHLDPLGIVCMLVFKIGWARPVPVNPNNYKNERLGNIAVSLAGVFMNIVFAILGALVYRNVDFFAIKLIAQYVIVYNVAFASFNLIPVPPLDGWGFISTFLPDRLRYKAWSLERYSFVILALLILTGAYVVIVGPIRTAIMMIVGLFL